MAFNRKNAIISFLEERAEQKFTPYDIAKWLVANYPEDPNSGLRKGEMSVFTRDRRYSS